MKTKNQKTIEEKIRNIVVGIAYSAGDSLGVGYEKDVEKIKSMISEVVREVIGKNMYKAEPENFDGPQKMYEYQVRGYNQAKQEIRQRCKKLGLEV